MAGLVADQGENDIVTAASTKCAGGACDCVGVAVAKTALPAPIARMAARDLVKAAALNLTALRAMGACRP